MTKEKTPRVLSVLFALMLGLTACHTSADHTSVLEGEPIQTFLQANPSTAEKPGIASGTPSFPSEEAADEAGNSETAADLKNNEVSDMPSYNALSDAPSPQVTPGLCTLENFLRTAMLPLGNTMYVWGGGWNEEDTGAGTEACTIGPSPQWKDFADRQSATYDYKETRYQIHNGLDCSGFVGWVIYNTMETENGKDGFVFKSTEAAKTYASYGWGEYLPSGSAADWRPGDIASMKGHVWICLGTCEDGSVLLVHSSPPGVRLCGTLKAGKDSDAVKLAEELMREHAPDWYQRFPDCSVAETYLTASGQMRWKEETMPDCAGIQSMTAEEIADFLFP